MIGREGGEGRLVAMHPEHAWCCHTTRPAVLGGHGHGRIEILTGAVGSDVVKGDGHRLMFEPEKARERSCGASEVFGHRPTIVRYRAAFESPKRQ